MVNHSGRSNNRSTADSAFNPNRVITLHQGDDGVHSYTQDTFRSLPLDFLSRTQHVSNVWRHWCTCSGTVPTPSRYGTNRSGIRRVSNFISGKSNTSQGRVPVDESLAFPRIGRQHSRNGFRRIGKRPKRGGSDSGTFSRQYVNPSCGVIKMPQPIRQLHTIRFFGPRQVFGNMHLLTTRCRVS